MRSESLRERAWKRRGGSARQYPSLTDYASCPHWVSILVGNYALLQAVRYRFVGKESHIHRRPRFGSQHSHSDPESALTSVLGDPAPFLDSVAITLL